MAKPVSHMRQEINEIPDAVERLLTQGGASVQRAVEAAQAHDVQYLLSVARGSSDHACTYLKYASELLLGLPMASVGPSVASIYDVQLRAKGALCLSVSQSGKSPDIVRMTQAVGVSGGCTVAITNDTGSPLAEVASATLPIHAGPELSVAATKTFVTSLVAGLWLLAELKRDTAVLDALHTLPGYLAKAIKCDWSPLVPALQGGSVYTLGRGPSWAISNEAALKFKEVCQIHAESYSSAEVLHGPVSIVGSGFPVLGIAAGDAAEQTLVDVADSLADKGASVFVTSANARRATVLPHQRTDHWLTDPIASIVTFYATIEAIATSSGINPDTPRHLNKVTQTV